MGEGKNIDKNPWLSLYKSTGRRLAILQIGANMAGAGIVTCYFFFFDNPSLIEDLKTSISVIGIMCVGLVCLATVVLSYFQKDLERFVKLKAASQPIDSKLQKKVQRIVLDIPFISAMMSLFNWFLAAVIMTLYVGLKYKANSEGSICRHFFRHLKDFYRGYHCRYCDKCDRLFCGGNCLSPVVAVFFSRWRHGEGPLYLPPETFRPDAGHFYSVQHFADYHDGSSFVQQGENDAGVEPGRCHPEPAVSDCFFAGNRLGDCGHPVALIFYQHHRSRQPDGSGDGTCRGR